MEKKKYSTPEIEQIKLDSQISLALESTPPEGPDELGQLSFPASNPDNSPLKA
jgi:hypothetical protein